MAYSKTVWNNNTPPDISAENLNKMEQGIYDAQFPDGGSAGQILSKTNDGTGWVDAPTSAEWGNITGQLSEQTDLYSELESKITLPSGGTTGQVLTKTASGQAWDDVDGLPSGGTAGQVLTKNSSTDGDASWQDVDGLPAGGTAGQVLTKNSSTDGDASWQTLQSGGGTWGSITGTLSDQTDLNNALSAKANASNLATIESSTTASQAYSVGDYLVLNGQLYEVTADVDSGETLVVGTNISATTVGSELTALNNSLNNLQDDLTTSLSNVMADNAGAHNAIFRGKSLGTSVTAEQWAAISAGTFDDLFVGDYWTINSKVYRIAGFDIFLHRGDTALKTHHAVILPDANMYDAQMNSTDTTTGGYYGSAMKTSNLASALSTVQTDFGSSHILTRRAILTNAVSGDAPSGWAWYDSKIDLMTEAQVYGQYNWAQPAQNGFESGIDYDRLPLFSHAPEFICNRTAWWLRSIHSSTHFALVTAAGFARYYGASGSFGVRPLFLIG